MCVNRTQAYLFLKSYVIQRVLTFCRMGLYEREGRIALPHIPDTQHPVLPSCGHYVLLIWVFIHTVQGHSVPGAARTQHTSTHNKILTFRSGVNSDKLGNSLILI